MNSEWRLAKKTAATKICVTIPPVAGRNGFNKSSKVESEIVSIGMFLEMLGNIYVIRWKLVMRRYLYILITCSV